MASRVLELAAPAIASGRPLLDAGCGTGWWLERLAAEGIEPDRLFGIDVLADRVARARLAAVGATVVEGDVRSLPWPEATFGLVTLFTVLSSLADRSAQRVALAEARRVTAPGGLVVVWEPRWPAAWNRQRRPVPFDGLPGRERSTETITLLPAVARRLGRATSQVYPVLARVPALRSHRLVVWRSRQL